MSPPAPPRSYPLARRAILLLILVLALFLTGTIVVLGTVSLFLALPSEVFLTEIDVPWDAEDAIWPIDPQAREGLEDIAEWRYYMREDWDGRVRDTDSWDRLYDIVPLDGERIPRLIHQTWKTDVLPSKWRDAWVECREGMPDYEYMLWTDELSREFIEKHYPDFLETYDGYQYPIERADAIRYFILYHFGGIYMDLDIGCRRRLDNLLDGDWEVLLPVTKPVGVSNDLLFAAPKAEFMASLIDALPDFDRNWGINYPTVMFSTGPMFVSLLYSLWTSDEDLDDSSHPTIRILPKSLYGKNALPEDAPHAFFSHFYGSSWHDGDAGFWWFLADWGRPILIALGIVICLAVIRLVWIRRQGSSPAAEGYTALPMSPLVAEGPSSPRKITPHTMPPSPSFVAPLLPGAAEIVKAAGSRLRALPFALVGRSGPWRRPSAITPTIRIDQSRSRRSSEVSAATLVDSALAGSPLLRGPNLDEKALIARAMSPRRVNWIQNMGTGADRTDDGMAEVDKFLRAHAKEEV